MSFASRTKLCMVSLALAASGPVLPKDTPHDRASERDLCGSAVPAWELPACRDPASASAAEIGCAVAAWQLAANNDLSYVGDRTGSTSYERGWVKPTIYIDPDYFAGRMGDRYWHGDDQAVAAVYGAMATRISGDTKYADYAAVETRAAIEYLQDPETSQLYAAGATLLFAAEMLSQETKE